VTETEISFWATIAQVRTMADGGIRVTLDLPEDTIMQAAQLMECKRVEAVLAVTIQIDDKSGKSRKIQI